MSELLAKGSGETIAEHTIWCLKVAAALLESLPLRQEERERVQREVLLAVALHDLGKAAVGFQRVLRGEQRDWGGKRHEILSAAVASSVPKTSSAAMLAILTHHRALPGDGITAMGFGCLPVEQIPWEGDLTAVWEEMAWEWNENREVLKEEWLRICDALTMIGGGDKGLGSLGLELSPLALGRAWLDRTAGKRGQRKVVSFRDRYQASLVRGLTVSADHLGSAHRMPSPIPDLKGFRVLKQRPRPFQEATGKIEGSAILRAPTGSGKTEAALLWAQRNQRPNGRLFYVLPYTASINAMYKRLGPGVVQDRPGIFGLGNVGLLHSRATAALYGMLEADGDDCSRLDRQENAKALTSLARELWFPIRVCTPHQILRHMLRGKGWETMLAEFPNGCFIFDEVHAYDPRVVGLTLAAATMAGHWGARSLFLSATLPEFLQELIRRTLGDMATVVPDETAARDREIVNRKRHALEVREGKLADELDGVIQDAQLSRSTLIVCNHVRTAQAVFDRLRRDFGDAVTLLHSRFNQKDRNHIEGTLVTGSLPKVLVATQVVEVSLDVDFDQAFLEPAPMDAIVQRMGRVNRAGLRDPCTVVVFTGQVGQHNLYCGCHGASHEDTCRVHRSIEELRKARNPISEKDLVDAANRVYVEGYQGTEKQAFDEGLSHPDTVDFEKRLLAGAHQDWVEQIIESTDGVVEVLPKSLFGEYEARRHEGLWIEANALLVSMRLRFLNQVRGRLDTSGDPWVLDCAYSSTRGLEL